ncbi:hypothetical protein OIU78_004465 [Salix suchowensis]|nr:hypothetical protein OIU78_004465 [Salix suchowensis]
MCEFNGSKVIWMTGSIRAVISNDDKALDKPNKEGDNKEVNGTELSRISIQLVSEEIDPETNSGKSVRALVKGWLPKPSNNEHIFEYAADFTVSFDFGNPGAILVTNLHGKEPDLPSQTPPGIKDLRREDLLGLRGNGKGKRKPHDRIYDYALYNDLGGPDKDEELARSGLILGVVELVDLQPRKV